MYGPTRAELWECLECPTSGVSEINVGWQLTLEIFGRVKLLVVRCDAIKPIRLSPKFPLVRSNLQRISYS